MSTDKSDRLSVEGILRDMEKIHSVEAFIDQKRKQKAMSIIRQAAVRKEIRYVPSAVEILRIQLQYISKGYWLGQLAFIGFMALLLFQTEPLTGNIRNYLSIASSMAALLGVLGITELGKHFSYHMAELEQSCFLNLQQMWVIKMILFGAVDIIVLSLFAGGITFRTGRGFGEICIYLLVPFVLSNLCYLFLLSAVRGGGRKYAQIAAAVLSGVLAAAPSACLKAYYTVFLWVWISVLAVGVVLLAMEIYVLYGKLKKGEAVCWN